MKEFETEHFRLKIDDDFIKEVTVKKGVKFSSEDMKETLLFSINAFKPDTKFYVLLMGEEGATISSEAKTIAASEKYSNTNHALAICADTLLRAISGNLYLRIKRPKTPTRYFETRDEALVWLKGLAPNVTK